MHAITQIFPIHIIKFPRTENEKNQLQAGKKITLLEKLILVIIRTNKPANKNRICNLLLEFQRLCSKSMGHA